MPPFCSLLLGILCARFKAVIFLWSIAIEAGGFVLKIRVNNFNSSNRALFYSYNKPNDATIVLDALCMILSVGVGVISINKHFH